MFKYLLFKVIYELSDSDVFERSKYDMSFKYFLDMAPEDPVIESSSLTKFRKLRLNVVKSDEVLVTYPSVKEKINILEETIADNLEKLALSKDEDGKVGHKTYDTSFFGYKTHIAMTEERIITSATVA